MIFDVFIEYLDKVTILLSIPAYFFIVINWMNNKKLQEDISIFLQYKDEKISLLQTLRRMHCSRSEIQGLLRAAYGGGTYKLSFLAGKEFSKRLKDVQSNDSLKDIFAWLLRTKRKKSCELVIKLEEEEKAIYEKFKANIEKINAI